MLTESLVSHVSGVHPEFQGWLQKAAERTFSVAAGNRMGRIAPKIMEVGYAKILYAANELGVDVDGSKSFVFFAPDGTCSLNLERTRRGFAYGGLFSTTFDGLMATNNSMPNGCGFSVYMLNEEIDDVDLLNKIKDAQCRLGEEEIKQLGKGNHFAAMYRVKDPVSGEDTLQRYLVVHCSGHVGGELLYYPETWLCEEEGYYLVETPHGSITFLEGEARKRYVEQFRNTEEANSRNRDKTAEDIFYDLDFRRIESITHQGLLGNGEFHLIGTQRHDSMAPIAFNPEEGLVAARNLPNLNSDFLDRWEHGQRARDLGLEQELKNLNLTPHGGGYESRFPVKSLEITLDNKGIYSFTWQLKERPAMSFPTFRHIREWLTYRRKWEIMRVVAKTDMAKVIFDLEPLFQVYPVQSIPGGKE